VLSKNILSLISYLLVIFIPTDIAMTYNRWSLKRGWPIFVTKFIGEYLSPNMWASLFLFKDPFCDGLLKVSNVNNFKYLSHLLFVIWGGLQFFQTSPDSAYLIAYVRALCQNSHNLVKKLIKQIFLWKMITII